MKGTVPASELDDSDTPEDAPDNDGRNLGREAAGAIDTAKEAASESDAEKTQVDPLKAPAAAAVTTGGSAPVPQESVITTPQGTVKEGGFLRRLASFFSPSKAASADPAASAAASQGAALQQLGRGSPLDVFSSALASLGASRFLPPEIRKEAAELRSKLMDPVADLSAVDSWLQFVAAPMSPSSPRAAAMHQWAFFILCLRFRELGKSVDKFLKKLGIDISADLPIDDMLLSHQDDEGAGAKLCDETLSQLSRLQQLAPQDAGGFFNRAIPLPPSYDGGREGRLGVRREKKKDGRKIWHLEFAFDLERIGPVEIRAVASFPEIRLSYVAQTLDGLQALQSRVPDLERQLEDLGLEPRSSSPRIGRVDAMKRQDEGARNAPKAPDGMVDVDI
ncbi:MAG: flagellar hook-length control protein FliK [Succinivibrio sp.]